MIDPILPIEFAETGDLVEFVNTIGHTAIRIRVPSGVRRGPYVPPNSGRTSYTYDRNTGVMIISPDIANRRYTIRNVINDTSEMEYDV